MRATVGSIVGGTFGLVRAHLATIAIWAVLYCAVMLAIGAITSLLLVGSVQFGNPAAMAPMMRPAYMPGLFLLTMLLQLLVAAVMVNAVFRAVLRPEERGFAFLRVGIDELRMAGLILAVAIVAIIGMILAELITLFLVALLGFVVGNGDAAGVIAVLLFLALIGGAIWVEVRLSLIFPLTFYRRRFAVDAGWELGRGRFWLLFGAYLSVALILFLVFGLYVWAIVGDYMVTTWSVRGNAEQMQAAALAFQQQQAAMGIGVRLLMMATGAVLSAVGLALGPGVVAVAVRELLAERSDRPPSEPEPQSADAS